jgi:hypothetical protein
MQSRSGSFAIGFRFSEMAEATDMHVDVSRGTLISALPREAKDYLGAFGIAAVVIYRDGRIGVSRDPAGAVAAWWVEADQAEGVVKQARKNGGDILAASRKLGVTLTAHDVVIARAKAATARVDNALSEAQACGDLQFFNREYKRRRTAAAAAGQSFMSYGQARTRLHKTIATVAASGGALTRALIESVFGR